MVSAHTHIASTRSTAIRAVALAFAATLALAASADAQRSKQRTPVSPAPDLGLVPVPFCFGDPSSVPCPCDNPGAPWSGCQNSALTGGAQLRASGQAVLSADTLQFHVRGELSTSLSIVLQGTAAVRPQGFGDGLRCVSGQLTRLYIRTAADGAFSLPKAGEDSISVRTAALGDPLVGGDTRFYQVYYRDPRAAYCSGPVGGGFNISNGLAVVWTR